MKSVRQILLIIAAAGLGLVVGFVWRVRRIAPNTVSVADLTVSSHRSAAQTSPAMQPRRVARPHDDSPLATQLERDLAMSTGVTRWLYWMEALEKAAPTDFPRLVQLARGQPATMKFVAARWVDVAPRHLFDTLIAAMRAGHGPPDEALVEALLDQWPKRDPDAAIAALDEAGDLGGGWSWRSRVAYAVAENDVERSLQLSLRWVSQRAGFGPRGMRAVAKWTQADPRHAAEFMLTQPADYCARDITEAVGREWAKVDPASALNFAVIKPGDLGSALASSALKQWAEQNLPEAAAWLASADTRARHRLSPAFVEVWAKEDAPRALEWCEANLTGSGLTKAVSGVVTGAAEKNLANAATLVEAMAPSSVRSEAAVAVGLKMFPDLSSDKGAPAEMIAWLGRLDSDSVRRVLNRLTWNWASSDPKSLGSFLATWAGEPIPSDTYEVVAREWARRDPVGAVAWADGLPEARALDTGGTAFAEWRSAQPDTATRWWNDLPAGDPRRQPYFEAVIRGLAYHPQAAEQLASMTASERATARTVFETMPLEESRRARLLELLEAR